jgi:hypothetical protein
MGSAVYLRGRVSISLTMNVIDILLTYPERRDMEYAKCVVTPIRQVAPRTSLRGLQEDYEHINADVVLLEGEIHNLRKPVSSIIRATKRHHPQIIFQGLPPLHFYS